MITAQQLRQIFAPISGDQPLRVCETLSGNINTILKIIAYPAIALYGYYTARNQYKANKEKIGARSPRLFPSLTINMRLSNLDNEEASNDSIGRNSPFVTN